jgi:hypothetical protein
VRCRGEVFVGEREEGAPSGRDRKLVPGERGAALKAWAVYAHNRDAGYVYRRAGNDGGAESFGGEQREKRARRSRR